MIKCHFFLIKIVKRHYPGKHKGPIWDKQNLKDQYEKMVIFKGPQK